MGAHKNDEIIRDLYKKFDLDVDDVFTKEVKGRVHYRIITRRGIDKIEAKSDALLMWKYAHYSDDCVGIDITATKHVEDGADIVFHTNGEADRYNVKQQPAYLAAMALARAKSRAVLGIEDFYKYGFYSEDEAAEFKDFVKGERGIPTKERGTQIKTGESTELLSIPKNLKTFKPKS